MRIQREVQLRVCPHCGYDKNEAYHPVCHDCSQPLSLTATVHTKTIETDAEFSPFSARILAWIIDLIILVIIFFVVSLITGGLADTAYEYGLTEVIEICYVIGFWTWAGRTPGKMIMGITIVTANGKQLTFGRAILRYFGYIISTVTLFVGFIWAAFDHEAQGFHDKIAGTYVIKG